MEAIQNRRSIRHYVAKPVEPEKIEALVAAAVSAPSARNSQPWEFILVDDRVMLEKIMQIHPYSKMLAEAPAAFIVCADLSVYGDGNSDFYLIDCAAAIENLLLEACELELGTCWLGVAPNPEPMKALGGLFGLPEGVVVHSMVAVGYPDEAPDARPRRKITLRRNKY